LGTNLGIGESKIEILEQKWGYSREHSCWALSQLTTASWGQILHVGYRSGE